MHLPAIATKNTLTTFFLLIVVTTQHINIARAQTHNELNL